MYKNKHIILYDGVCRLCNGFIRLIIKRDKDDRFRFIALSSDRAKEILAQLNLDPKRVDSLVLIKDFQSENQTVFIKSDSVLESLILLGGGCKSLRILRIFPKPIRDFVYQIHARLRHLIWGRYVVCPIPPKEVMHKFID